MQCQPIDASVLCSSSSLSLSLLRLSYYARIPHWSWTEHNTASFMSVPETAVHENDRPVLPEYQIRMSRKSRIIQSISEPTAEQELPDQQFRLRIPPFYRRHTAVSLFFRELVHISRLLSYSFIEIFVITVYYSPNSILPAPFSDNELHICHSLKVFTHLSVRNTYIHSHFSNCDSRI